MLRGGISESHWRRILHGFWRFLIPPFICRHTLLPRVMNIELAFYLTAILNEVSFSGRVSAGMTGDKLSRLNLLCFAGVCSGILALCWQKMTSNTAIIVFAALYGFPSGAIISLAKRPPALPRFSRIQRILALTWAWECLTFHSTLSLGLLSMVASSPITEVWPDL